MTEKPKSCQELLKEVEDLRSRLAEAEKNLREQSGDVDASAVGQPKKMQKVELKRADFPYDILFDSIGGGVVTLNSDGTIFFYNSRFAEIIQSTPEQLIGSSFYDLFSPEETDALATLVKNASKDIARGEFGLQSGTGNRTPVQLSAHLLTTGDFEGITVVVTDISTRKWAEQTRKEFDYQMNLLLQSLTDGVVVVDLSGEITYANPAAEQLLEIQRDVTAGKYHFSDKLTPVDANLQLFPVEQLPLALVLKEKRVITSAEYGLTTHNGEIKWLSVTASPITNEEGILSGAIAIFRDVSTWHQTLEDLLNSKERIAFQASILDQARNAVIATDLEWKIIYWNKFAETLYQWKAEEVVGKFILDVIAPQVSNEFGEEMFEQIQITGKWEGDINVHRKDGDLFLAHLVENPIIDSEGEVTGTVGVTIDLTERLQNKRQIQNLSKFPEENPFPVMRNSADCKLLYANKSSKPILDMWNIDIG